MCIQKYTHHPYAYCHHHYVGPILAVGKLDNDFCQKTKLVTSSSNSFVYICRK